MKRVLLVVTLLCAMETVKSQNIVFTRDSFYVASGIMAKGMAIEMFELDSVNKKPILVHSIGSKEKVTLVIFKSVTAQDRFLAKTEREGLNTFLVPEWPDWLKHEIENNPKPNYIEVAKRLTGNYAIEKSTSPLGKHLALAGVHLGKYRTRQLQAASLLIVTSLSATVLWPVLVPEAIAFISAVGGIGSIALWYDGLREVARASENLQKAGKLAEDTPSF